MQDQAKAILGNLVQNRFYMGQNFPEILNVLEDVVAAAVIQAVNYPASNLVGNAAEDVLLEFNQRVRGKVKEVEGVVRMQIELQAEAKKRDLDD
jgi:hypothetical protein